MDIKERGWLRREAVCRSALQHYGYCVLLLISGARSFIFRRLDGVREEDSGSGGRGEIKFRVQVFVRRGAVTWTGLLTPASLCVLLSPDDVPAGMGLQESSEQIPGQCSLEAKGRKDACDSLFFFFPRVTCYHGTWLLSGGFLFIHKSVSGYPDIC